MFKKKRNAFGRRCAEIFRVEVAGVEPASEEACREPFYMLISFWVLASARKKEQNHALAIRLKFKVA